MSESSDWGTIDDISSDLASFAMSGALMNKKSMTRRTVEYRATERMIGFLVATSASVEISENPHHFPYEMVVREN